MHQRSWKILVAGGAALAVGVTLTAFGAPAHVAGVPGITSEARAHDEVMKYAVNLTADASPSVSGRPRSRVCEAWVASAGSVSCGGGHGIWEGSRRCQAGAAAYMAYGHGLGVSILACGDYARIMHVIIWLVFRCKHLYMDDLPL